MVQFRARHLARPWPLAALTLALAVVVAAGAIVVSWMSGNSGPTQLGAAPADLQVPNGLGDDLHQWCTDRQAQGTAGLSNSAKAWLNACVEASNPNVGTSQTPTAAPTPKPTTAGPVPTTPLPPTQTTTRAPGGPCPVAGKNVPGAADPWGGCWPGPGNTGVPAGTALAAYTGPCTITAANTVIDSKTVNCDLVIRASGVVIRKSRVNGSIDGSEGSGSSFLLQDSTVVNPARADCLCVGSDNFTVVRSEIRGAYREIYCRRNCVVQDSWVHGQQLIASLAQHASGIRQEQGSQVTHTVLSCDWALPNDNTSLGCSADLGGYPDFAPVHNNTYRRNLFIGASRDPANPNPPSGQGATTGFCAFGGATTGKPFSGDATNGTFQVFVENVFQRGARKCGDFGPITDFAAGRTGNVWSGNAWDDGTAVSA